MAAPALALDTARRPKGNTAGLRRLTRALDALVANDHDARTTAARVGMLLHPALADPNLLELRHREPAADRYRQHVVHVHPTGAYSIVALVWRPGQATSIHDHRCWCVVGVWQGVERETTYDFHGDDSDAHLVVRSSALSRAGDVSVLVPPDEDIHRVENGGDELAISLHIYGDDIAVHGSSINATFDELPVLTASTAGARAWRAAA